MKFKYVLILLFPVFMIIGCDDDSSTTAAVDPCIALFADMIEKSTDFTTGIMSGSFENATDCTDYIAAAQAYLNAGCSMCEASDEVQPYLLFFPQSINFFHFSEFTSRVLELLSVSPVSELVVLIVKLKGADISK